MRKIHFRSRNLFLTLFLSGFAAGVLYIALFGRSVVHETTLMSSYFFSKYQQIEFAADELFVYTLRARLLTFTVLWLTGLTVLGTVSVYLYILWIGAALGITATAAAMKLGIMGILLCVASGLPHFILYVPAGCWLLKRICAMSGGGEWKTRPGRDSRSVFFRYLAVWLSGALLLLLGAFLESYVNPIFLKTVLRKI